MKDPSVFLRMPPVADGAETNQHGEERDRKDCECAQQHRCEEKKWRVREQERRRQLMSIGAEHVTQPSLSLTSTTAAVFSKRRRLTQTSLAKHADVIHRSKAHRRSPVVPHQVSGAVRVSKLAAIAHHPHRNKEKGMAIAVASKTGRTVRRSKRRNRGGRARAGRTRTNRRGSNGTIEGLGRGAWEGD